MLGFFDFIEEPENLEVGVDKIQGKDVTLAELTSAALTDVGRRRPNNEDALISLPEHGVFCVADGMGGQAEGEVASQAVVDAYRRVFDAADERGKNGVVYDSRELSSRAMQEACRWIFDRSQARGTQGSGTTAVTLVFGDHPLQGAMIQHAGDSRVYRFRGRTLELCTTDHSVAALAGVADEASLPAMFRGMVTRAVGVQETVEIEETGVDVRCGDLFLVCSDGLTRMIPDLEIARILEKSDRSDMGKIAQKLVDRANEEGGDDNISVILVAIPA